MDERVQQLKQLKKAYKKQRRQAVWHWDLMWYMLLAVLALAVFCLCYVIFYKTFVIRIIDLMLWTPVKYALGIRQNLLPVGLFVLKYGRLFVAGFGVLFVLVWILRSRAVARTRKLDSFLDYKTMKNTLKTEKQEAKR